MTPFHIVTDRSLEGVTITDERERFIYVNEAAARIMGYDSPAEVLAETSEALAAKFERFGIDRSRLELDDMPPSQVKGGNATQDVLVGFRVKGTFEERWSMVRSVPIKDAADRIVNVITYFREVTDEVREREHRAFLLRAADELSSSLDYEHTLSTVAHLLVPKLSDWCAVDLVHGGQLKRVAIAHVDPSKIELVAAIERSYPVDQTQGHGVAEVIRTGRPEFIVDITPQMLAGAARDAAHLDMISRLQLRSFICVPLQIRGRVVGAISMAMAESGRQYTQKDFDLATALADRSTLAIENARLFTEANVARALAAAERDATEQTFQLMVQSVKDHAIFLLDPTGHVMSWNDGAELMKGYTRQEIVGRHFSCFYSSDDRAAGLCDSLLALAIERGSIQQEGWRIRKDGSRFRAHVVLTAVRDNAGVLRGFAKVTRDLTERTLSQEALAAESARRAQAEQQSKFVETFVAFLGHDLRNPLHAIAIGAELLKAEGKANPVVSERIANSTRRMSRMVSQLLDLTRIRLADGIPIDRKPTNLAAVVRQVVEELRPAHPNSTIVISGDTQVSGQWDADRLEQVASNLVSNAIEHGQLGTPVRVSLTATSLDATVAVTNFGPPIPPDALEVLFDPFRRVESRIDPKSGGLGLGLFITQQIVKGHGGTISCSSNQTDGTTFNVVLPRA